MGGILCVEDNKQISKVYSFDTPQLFTKLHSQTAVPPQVEGLIIKLRRTSRFSGFPQRPQEALHSWYRNQRGAMDMSSFSEQDSKYLNVGVPITYFMLGRVEKDRPVGSCMFIRQFWEQGEQKNPMNAGGRNMNDKSTWDKQEHPFRSTARAPAMILTLITGKNWAFHEKSLVVYDDLSFYIGALKAHGGNFPKASGKGILATRNAIYEGQFEEGLPEGFGLFQSKFQTYAGYFTRGKKIGEFIERRLDGLWIGNLKTTAKRKTSPDQNHQEGSAEVEYEHISPKNVVCQGTAINLI